jgi:hypothetical protein
LRQMAIRQAVPSAKRNEFELKVAKKTKGSGYGAGVGLPLAGSCF